jgi:hypothetical protein
MISLQFFMCYQRLIYADVILIATIAANPFGRNRMRWQLSPKYLIVTLVATAAAGTAVRAQTSVSPAVVLAVDERQAARRIAFVHEDIAAAPGSLTLAYPRWIPGEHGPTGPIQQVGNLRIRSGSTVLSWTRDPDDIYNIRVNVPPGGDHISVDFDALAVNTVSDHQLLVAWNTVVLYPRGVERMEPKQQETAHCVPDVSPAFQRF